MLNRDDKEMLCLLQSRKVEFIVVGAYSLAAHGYPRSTGDIDIWINPTQANARNVYGALAEFEYLVPPKWISPRSLGESTGLLRWGVFEHKDSSPLPHISLSKVVAPSGGPGGAID